MLRKALTRSLPTLETFVLHETTISWLRKEEEKSRPTKPWEETPVELDRRLQRGVKRINAGQDVRGLSLKFPGRLDHQANMSFGDRLPN